MRKILITGAAGFIGFNFSKYWLKKYPEDKLFFLDKAPAGPDHINSDKVFSKHAEVLQSVGEYFCTDLSQDLYKLKRILENVDIVVNFASNSHVDNSISGPTSFYLNNVALMANLLEAIRLYNPSIKLFHISTDEVLRHFPPKRLSFCDFSFEKAHPKGLTESNSPYSASKLAQESLCNAYIKTFGLNIDIIRLCNQYGPCQHPEKFVPTIIKNLLADNPVPIYGDGNYFRDWMFVHDTCSALDMVITRSRMREIWQIAANNEKSNLNMVFRIASLLDLDYDSVKFNYVKDRPGHDKSYSMKLHLPGKFQAYTPLYLGLGKTIEHYRTNK